MKRSFDKLQEAHEEKRAARLQEFDLSPSEAGEILRAIRNGEVDALVVSTEEGDKVFTLTGADQPYRVMIEMLTEGAATLSADGTIFYCNHRFAEMVQMPLEKMIGTPIFHYIDPIQEKAFKAYFRKSHRETSRIESAFRTKNGTTTPVLLSISDLRIEGAPVSACLVAADITPLRAAQKALQNAHDELEIRVRERTAQLTASEERHQLLSKTAARLLNVDNPQSIVEDLCRDVMEHLDCQVFFNFLVDEKSARLHLNACAGIPEEDAYAIEWLDDGDAVCGCFAQCRERIIAENILHTRDTRTDLVRSYGIQDYCCHPLIVREQLIGTLSFGTKTRTHFKPEEIGLMKTVSDYVSVAIQRKKTEEEIAVSRDKLQSVIDNTPALIYAFDMEGRFLTVNRALAALLNASPTEMIGKNRRFYMPADIAERHEANDRRVITEGTALEFEESDDFNGREIAFLTYKFPLCDSQGRIYAVAGVSVDITDRKQIEDQLKIKTAKLEEANAEIESFSYSVSHDLRAPLRAIDGYARMLLKKHESEFDEDSLRKFNIIRSNAQTMGQLIEGILMLSRLGKEKISAADIDMAGIIRSVWVDIQTEAAGRKLNLTVGDMPMGYGDKLLIKQVCWNLLSNAVKFTKFCDCALIETGGHVDGNDCVYYVKDNGVGFDMAYFDKLFGVFQRLHKAEEFDGTGIGLATVKRVIKRHGGRVWAESKPDGGATFYFSLPLTGNK